MSAGPQPERPVGSTRRSRLDNSRGAPSDPATARQDSGAHRSQVEPLSPELALVDPELAARARAALAHTPAPADGGGRPPVPRYVQPRPSSAGPPAVVGERGRGRAAAVLAFAGIVALVAAGVAGGVWLRDSEKSTDQPPVAGRDMARPEPPPNRPQPTPPAAAPAPPPAAPSSARTFAWAAVPGAIHYRVELFRRGSKILDARTRTSRLVMPTRWRYAGRRIALRPGRYWWRVRPAFGARSSVRYGKPVVSAALVISAEDS